MKIFISADIEGVACVTDFSEIFPMGDGAYQMARRWMTAEVNAAAEGAFEAGATEVIVADSHSKFRNILPDELNPDILLVRGAPRPMHMMQGLDESCDAAFFIGYHARFSALRGVLGHTFMEQISEARLNGKVISETGFNAAVAGHFGVPIALVSGDDVIAEEVGQILPHAEQVITKKGLGLLSVQSLTPKKAQEQIHEGAIRALGRLSEMQPLVADKPVRLELDFGNSFMALVVADVPGIEMIGERTVSYTAPDMVELTRVFRVMLNLTMGHPAQGGRWY
jgi:D-amino peptidase